MNFSEIDGLDPHTLKSPPLHAPSLRAGCRVCISRQRLTMQCGAQSLTLVSSRWSRLYAGDRRVKRICATRIIKLDVAAV
ncbi:uncharacterized protein EI90DRAFT_3065652 [Cantharellus anzutake]|uniref:uncharacterized protein n=1 Tax=Cantharellus anzutake TaxID=1750568 RepID=UPI0019033C2A|nr:uncharacterized protein EI90DRAFT_3065652 [Cantharellus anzutake]KAF8328114.1 hypothetical protein EI90DRAFT_3065652 [Cantharellus anzutake]